MGTCVPVRGKMPKNKSPVILHGKNGEAYFMNRAAKRKALKLNLKGHHVPQIPMRKVKDHE